MRAVLAAVIFVGVSPGFAAEPSQAGALYRLSGKYAVCAAYYTVGVTCLRNESVRADYLEAQHKETIFGYAAGAKAGVSVEGLYFESENAMDSPSRLKPRVCWECGRPRRSPAFHCFAIALRPPRKTYF